MFQGIEGRCRELGDGEVFLHGIAWTGKAHAVWSQVSPLRAFLSEDRLWVPLRWHRW